MIWLTRNIFEICLFACSFNGLGSQNLQRLAGFNGTVQDYKKVAYTDRPPNSSGLVKGCRLLTPFKASCLVGRNILPQRSDVSALENYTVMTHVYAKEPLQLWIVSCC
jgi:hypothetical protein